MRSAYAVTGQMAVSASNYVIFVVFARGLEADSFVAFSTAVGLNMLALAIAEGGVSYVAPRELAGDGRGGEATVAGAFLSIGVVLYVLAGLSGFLVWNALATDGLDAAWSAGYAAYAVPALLVPAWATCWTLDAVGLAGILGARGLMVAAVIAVPGPGTLALAGLSFAVFVAWLYGRLNHPRSIIAPPSRESLGIAVRRLADVFVAKTASYAMYGMAPMMIGITRGSLMASDFVTGERLKALYCTLFQPLIQSAYLAQFQGVVARGRSRLISRGIHGGNLLLGFVALLFIRWGGLALLGERFDSVLNLPLYLFAAVAAVASASILHFHVFPTGAFGVFRFATITQALVFISMFALVAVIPGVPVAWVLAVAEGALLGILLVRPPKTAPVGAPEAT